MKLCEKGGIAPCALRCLKVEVGAEDSGSAGFEICVVNHEVRCDESLELKDFNDLKFGMCGEVLFVLVPLLKEEGV